MAQEKLKMTKPDVQLAIAIYVKQKYQELDLVGRNKPTTIQKVLATIQDSEFIGAGKYKVLLDIYGSIVNENGDRNENIHYTAICSVCVASDTEGSPIPSLKEPLILTKQSF